MAQTNISTLIQLTDKLWIRPEEIIFIRPAHKDDGCSHIIVTLDGDLIPIDNSVHPKGIAGLLALVLKLNHIQFQDTYIVYDKIVSMELYKNENSYSLSIHMKNKQMHLAIFDNWESLPGFLKFKPQY